MGILLSQKLPLPHYPKRLYNEIRAIQMSKKKVLTLKKIISLIKSNNTKLARKLFESFVKLNVDVKHAILNILDHVEIFSDIPHNELTPSNYFNIVENIVDSCPNLIFSNTVKNNMILNAIEHYNVIEIYPSAKLKFDTRNLSVSLCGLYCVGELINIKWDIPFSKINELEVVGHDNATNSQYKITFGDMPIHSPHSIWLTNVEIDQIEFLKFKDISKLFLSDNTKINNISLDQFDKLNFIYYHGKTFTDTSKFLEYYEME